MRRSCEPALDFLGAKEETEIIIERMVQGNRGGSQPFACCCCRGHMDRSSQMDAKKTAKATAEMIGMFTKIITFSHPSGQSVQDRSYEKRLYLNN